MPSISLTGLPPDLLLQILQELTVENILILRSTCSILSDVTRERSVWHSALLRLVIQPGLPVPSLPKGWALASLSASQLETLTIRALRLRRNWTSSRPTCTMSVELNPPGLPPSAQARNVAVHHLPGRGNRWLLTVTFYDQPAAPRKYVIHCWDISRETHRCAATLRCMNMMGLVVNSDPNYSGVLALTRRGPSDIVTTSVFSLNFIETQDKEMTFTPIQEFASYRRAIALEGSIFVVTDSDNIIRLIDIDTGDLLCTLQVPLEHDDPTLRNEEHRCLAVSLQGGYALAFRRQWIHLYRLPNRTAPAPSTLEPSIPRACDPIASHKWNWRIDSLVICPRRSHLPQAPFSEHTQETSFPPIDILVRLDTWFPWPVNILQHYVLHSNSANGYLSPSHLPYLFSSSPSDGPVIIRSFPSPIRLFTPSDMVLGPYGTALWLDAQSADSGPAQVGDQGQRIAGQMLNNPDDTTSSAMASAARTQDDVLSSGHVKHQADEDGENAAVEAPRSSTSAQCMTFQIQEEHDGWNRIALNEEEGRIAVGTIDGRVFLFEYLPPDTASLA
ncbi:uncharacterized protein LAESUDRAFT_758763 [Laetiporus sulphureus 93-53]|uniref:F-box domain-containing protein n=1 Tax=Laetiporus sulphureus 93-53 TaxID=1314785 RepID=A0A165EM90_9APHY|nr:uncharacterized protein LAESUDRAFT_758763 [Laetiporus sulphureus 93-53]KZT07353.1 hypothetical protein LAESUDRAFT_758763 [Laetiporus sulphureus 93-53]